MRKSLTAYIDDDTRAKLDHIRAYYMERSPGVPMSDSATVIRAIDDVYQKILGGQTNQARITSIVERLDNLEETIKSLIQAIERLEGDGR